MGHRDFGLSAEEAAVARDRVPDVPNDPDSGATASHVDPIDRTGTSPVQSDCDGLVEPVDLEAGGADAALFRELYPSLRRFAAVVGDASTDPDDLVQDALVRVLSGGSLRRLDSPEAYLRRTILNAIVDGRRRGTRWRRVLRRSARPDEHRDSPPSELADLDELSPTDRAVIWLTEIEGYPQAEAAALLGLSHDAVRSRASRSRRRLRAAIESAEER